MHDWFSVLKTCVFSLMGPEWSEEQHPDLECAFWGFPPLFALLHLFPPLPLFVTNGP